MTTIYVVTEGCYSDYSICGVYSTKEKAEHAKVVWLDSDIEEYELDDLESKSNMFFYEVQMDVNGNTRKVSKTRPTIDAWWPCGGMQGDGFCSFFMWADNEKHAVKIANERRVQLIASNDWTTDWNKYQEYRNRINSEWR